MAKVLVFYNFIKPGERPLIMPENKSLHNYELVRPDRLYADPYKSNKKHMGINEFVRRVLMCLLLSRRSRNYDVLILDVSPMGLLTAFFLMWRKKPKIVISHFNVLRRRGLVSRKIASLLFRRINHFIVHSKNDIQLASELYRLPQERFTFWPYMRKSPASKEPPEGYLSDSKEPFILSFGVNARDYKTFFEAIKDMGLKAIVVTRKYCLESLDVPENVKVFFNIPLVDCDQLVSKSLFTVFTFDGSEPSCGQISIVTSFMLGKPTICTDIVGVHDYVSDGINGLLVKLGDADDLRSKMLKLAGDKQFYNHLSEGARSWADSNADLNALHEKVDHLVTVLV